MRLNTCGAAIGALAAVGMSVLAGELRGQTPVSVAFDPVRALVDRLDLEKYKAAIKGLTQLGDRRQGTDRNRAAIDWIETQLKSYGCTNTERLNYVYTPTAPAAPAPAGSPVIQSGEVRLGRGGSRLRGFAQPIGANNDP